LPFLPQGIDHKQVRGLDIPMDDALEMCSSQRRRSLLGKGHHFIRRQAFPTAPCEIVLERLAPQQFHHQVGASVLFPGVVNGANIGMVQRGRGACFAQEALMR
jgi:hypothetical protein